MSGRTLVWLALLGGGCVQVEGFDPVGDVAAISGSWTIDGEPASGQSCNLLGANRVRVTFVDDQRPVTHSALFFECQLRDFNTNEARGAGPVVGAGEWTVRLDAIDSSGDIVAVGPEYRASVPARIDGADAGPTQVIGGERPDDRFSANFFTATISTEFLVAGEGVSDERCGAVNIAWVELEFDDPRTDFVFSTRREPCRLGLLGTRVLPNVAHVVYVRAYDPEGALISERGPFEHTLEPGEDLWLGAVSPIDL